MNIAHFGAFLFSFPARLKAMKIGEGAYLGPGYSFIGIDFSTVSIGKKTVIGAGAFINPIQSGVIIVENGTNIGRRVTLSALKKISIGKNCLFGYDVSVLDHDHNVMDPKKSPVEAGLGKPHEVVIDDECFIGAHSFILKGVRLGKHCVVGAGSIVTKSFPAYSVIAGNPARIIKKIKKS